MVILFAKQTEPLQYPKTKINWHEAYELANLDISIPFVKLVGYVTMVAKGLVLESVGTKPNGSQEFVRQMQHDQEEQCWVAKPSEPD